MVPLLVPFAQLYYLQHSILFTCLPSSVEASGGQGLDVLLPVVPGALQQCLARGKHLINIFRVHASFYSLPGFAPTCLSLQTVASFSDRLKSQPTTGSSSPSEQRQDSLDAESSATVHWCQIESQRQDLG